MHIEFLADRHRNLPSIWAGKAVPVQRFPWLGKAAGPEAKCFVLQVDEAHDMKSLGAVRPGYLWTQRKIFRRGDNWFAYPGQPMSAADAADVLAGRKIIADASPESYEFFCVSPAEAEGKIAAGDTASYFAADAEKAERQERASAVQRSWLAAGEADDTEAAASLLAAMPMYLAIPAEKTLESHPFGEACRLIAATL